MSNLGKTGAMKYALAGVSDMDEAIHLFRDIMELQVERDGMASESLKAAWKLAPGTDVRLVDLSCKGYPIGITRLAQYTPTPTQKVRMDFGDNAEDTAQDVGPKALDYYVEDPIMPYVDKIKPLYPFRSLPVKHVIGPSTSEECLFSGPDGLPVLIMVGHTHPPESMRAGSPDGPFSEIPTISVVSGGVEATNKFYIEAMGLNVVQDNETPEEYREKVNELTGTPKGTRVRFSLFGGVGESSGKLLFVHFYEATGKRLTDRMKPGNLGFSMLSHEADDLDDLQNRLANAGGTIITPPTEVEHLDGPQRIMLVKGPNEEMLEFIER